MEVSPTSSIITPSDFICIPGLAFGNPVSWPFDHWIHQVPEVVIVSIYYRLSSFGFLAHPAFSNSKIADHNVGFLDQSEALRWIQAHIDVFGGDPKRVTIDGESGGGSAIALHLTSPPDKGLFSQAIGQSVSRQGIPFPQQQVVSLVMLICLYMVLAHRLNSPNSTFLLNKSDVHEAPLGQLCRVFARQRYLISCVPRILPCAFGPDYISSIATAYN